ncbi:NAD(P)H-hydrate dehydratase [Deinococcus cavernae]|uniref:Bifunctional NAD(P)H-hydrate repair enzyme n=1 Tax=Deinococcus cavernae TaxID=2320857 RepID=A0A418V5X9_9DEIO|nr:NAD(P)H-hydrate dehydratase [Deinococcus cavernae]RJF71514.1 NAD(P)H-hydrate dehydratase [Deinococcus cavernae]
MTPERLRPEVVLSPAGVRAIDARLERAGLLDLAMEEAGRAAADAIQLFFPVGQVLLLAGSGANGGDALVAARHLHALGRAVTVLALPSQHPLTRLNRRRLKAVGVEVGRLSAAPLHRALRASQGVVDGLLGTGFRPPLRPALQELVRLVNASGQPVIALDLPTGLDAGSAAVTGEPVQASVTVTFSGMKPALLYGPAAHHAGQVQLVDLRLPPSWALAEALATRPAAAEVARLLPVRFADAHKGTAGHVWVIGGHPGTVGAAALAGWAALRSGAGLVTVHSEAPVPLVTPELMIRQHVSLLEALRDTAPASRPQALCVGMGLGPQAEDTARLVLAWQRPTVLDADALQPSLAGAGHAQCIWTPHPGEAARLLGTDTTDVTRDPIQAARALQERLGGVVILKGGPSTIAAPDGIRVSRGGHPGMASAGMGDTLSGVLAALLGQGLSAGEAALAGTALHARAGELAGQQHGYGLSATDVIEQLGRAWQSLVLADNTAPTPKGRHNSIEGNVTK